MFGWGIKRISNKEFSTLLTQAIDEFNSGKVSKPHYIDCYIEWITSLQANSNFNRGFYRWVDNGIVAPRIMLHVDNKVFGLTISKGAFNLTLKFTRSEGRARFIYNIFHFTGRGDVVEIIMALK